MRSTKDLDEIKGMKSALKAKADEIDRITDAFEVTPDGVVKMGPQEAAYLAAVAEAQSLKALLDAKMAMSGLRQWLDAPEGAPSAGEAAAQAQHMAGKGTTLGEQVLNSEQWAEFKGSGWRNRNMVFATEGGMFAPVDGLWVPLGSKDVFSAAAGSPALQAFGTHQQRPIAEKLPRLVHVRELFPAEDTTASVLYGIRQSGFTNAAAPVPERRAADGVGAPTGGPTDVFGRAPRSRLTFETVTYPVALISHVEYAHQTVLDDDPRVRGIINRQMIEGVRLEEDDQILLGDGVGANLRGILNTVGVQTYNQPTDAGPPVTASEKKIVTLRRAITRVQLAEMAPTGVIVNPLDWEDLELETDDMGRFLLVTTIQSGSEERVWRLPVAPTTAMPEGRYLLGAFGLGAQLFDRRSVEVTVSTENQDMFERDAVTFKGSERIALTVDRPEAFVSGTLFVEA